MSNVEQTITNPEKINRLQTLKAMERIMLSLGGKEGAIAWLNAMPEGVALSAAGGVTQESLMDVAGNDGDYKRAVKGFARCMGAALTRMAEAE